MPGPPIRRLSGPLSALVCVLVCTLSASACGGGDGDRPPPRPRNVVLLTVDTLRADAVGAARLRDDVATPHLDRLAASGVYFTQAIAPLPRTTPSLASLLTGLYPQHHGSLEVGDPIRAGARTLAEILGERGYATYAVSANDTAGPAQELDRGFDRFVDYDALLERYDPDLYRDLTRAPPDGIGFATAVTDQALRLVADHPADRPYLLWVFYFDPHFLYRPPSPWQDDVAAARCWQLYEEYGGKRDRAGEVFADIGGVASRVVDDCRRLYDAEVAYVDAEAGRLLAALEARGLLEDTLVVFAADHGENLGEGGLFFEHGDNVHDAGIHVPLAFAGPGVVAGRRDDGVVSLVDVVPTVLSLLGVAADARPASDGIDLAPRLHGAGPTRRESTGRVVFAQSGTAMWNEARDQVVTGRVWWRVCIHGERYVLCEIPGERPGEYTLYDQLADPTFERDLAAQHPEEVSRLLAARERWPPESGRHRTARTSRFKLVETPRLEGGYEARLYDLQADPAESHDVQDLHPEVFAALRAELAAWAAEQPPPADRPPDPELEESLRALGYLR